MTQSCFEQNQKALAWHDPALVELLSGTKLSLPPFPTSSGLPTCRVRGEDGEFVFLHSQEDPVAEAAEAVQVGNEDAAFILGVGLGYTALDVVKKAPPWMWITIIEPDRGMLRAAMEYVDLTPLLKRENVRFFVGLPRVQLQEGLRVWFNQENVDNILLLSSLPLEHAHPSIYRSTYKDLQEVLNYRNSEVVTLLKYAELINRNTISNIPFMVRSQGVKVFENQFRDVPGIVVASGPSLERQVEALRKARDRSIIVAVGKSLQFLLKNGIEPHFVAHLDLGDASKVYFPEGKIPRSCTMVWDPEGNSPAVSAFPGDRITFDCGMDWEKRGEAFWGSKGFLQRGLSVAHTAFHFIRFLGVDPIVLVGVDLAFPGERTHAEGVTMTWGGGLESLEKVMRDVPSVTGEKVKTIPSFQAMVTLFETEISKTEARVVNTSDVGALIRGADKVSLESVLGNPVNVRDQIKAILDQPRPFNREVFQTFSDQLCASLERVFCLTDSGLRGLKRIKRLDLNNRNDREELNRLGKKINACKNDLEKEKDFPLILQRYFSPLALRVKKLAREKELCPPDDLERRTRLDTERLGVYFSEFQKGARFLKETFLPVKKDLLG